jgi:NADH-quinone oxidoreductase subunit L
LPAMSIMAGALGLQEGHGAEQAAGHAAELGAAVGHGPWYAAAIPALAMFGAIACIVFAILRNRSKLPAWVSVGCLGIAFLLTVVVWLGSDGASVTTVAKWINLSWGHGVGESLVVNWGFYIDSLTILWMLFVTGLGTLIALYASEYMEHDVGTGYCRFFFGFCLFVFSMSCLVMADNLVLLYLGWEGVGLCSYLLIGYFYKRPSAVAAAKKAFIMNRIGDLGLALGIMLIFVQFGTVEYATLFANADLQSYIAMAREGHFAQIPFNVQLIPVLLLIGAIGKSAQLPLYVWLPDAMEGPTPVSALIHAATMVTAGVFLIARMYPLFVCSAWALPTVAWVGTLTALLAATIGMAQFDIKRIMAYSTVSQLGYMFAGLGFLTSVGAAFHVFTHAFFKATLFLCCGAVMHGFAGQLDLRKISGLWKIPDSHSRWGWKIVTLAMLIGCLNLSGFPLTAGFFSKDMILAEAFVTPGAALMGWLLLLTAGLTAYYTFRVFFRVFVGPVDYTPGEEWQEDEHGHLADRSESGATSDDRSESGPTLGGATFHPHAPKWAINLVLATLAVSSVLVAAVYFVAPHGGWVAEMVHHSSARFDNPNTFHEGGVVEDGRLAPSGFLGFDPHGGIMFVASALVGLAGIGFAWWLHLAGRTRASTSRADELEFSKGAIANAARRKWYVDEIYDFLFRTPLKVFSALFYLFDKLLVDGAVDLCGWLPKEIGKTIRPSQNGLLHSYAAGMIGGAAMILVIVLLGVALL